jgi:nucleoside-diphosphate kinase
VKQTFVMIKPDGVERQLIGDIVTRLERRGLRLVAAELRQADAALARAHYAEHEGKPFFDGLVAFLTRGPVLAMVVEGPTDTWKIVRTMMGTTNPADSAPGTIRGDYATEMSENLIHGSDGPESAAREIALWFPVRA